MKSNVYWLVSGCLLFLSGFFVSKAVLPEPEVVCSWETEECTSTVTENELGWTLVIVCEDAQGYLNEVHVYRGEGNWSGFCPEPE